MPPFTALGLLPAVRVRTVRLLGKGTASGTCVKGVTQDVLPNKHIVPLAVRGSCPVMSQLPPLMVLQTVPMKGPPYYTQCLNLVVQ